MNQADYYPAGSYYDANAPWNETSVPEKEFEVTCSQTLSKTTTILTNDYIPGVSGVDQETDDEGHPYAIPWQDPDDTSDTNWAEEWHDNDHYTPDQLIALFKAHLENELNNNELPQNEINHHRHLMAECEGWIVDETEYMED